MSSPAERRIQLPRVGLGTSGIASLFEPVPLRQAEEILGTAWDLGLRYFDTAPHYGQGLSERRLGDFLRDRPDGSFILSTKVGRMLRPASSRHESLNGFCKPLPFDQYYDYTYDGVMRSFEDSLQRLGLHHVDILLVHEIGRLRHGAEHDARRRDLLEGGWRALDRLRGEGVVKAIGLGVNEVEICLDLIPRIDIDVVLLAGCMTLLDRSALPELLPLCAARGIAYVAAGVFNSGVLATGPGSDAHFDYGPVPDPVAREVERLQAVCRRHGTGLAEAALHFPLRDRRVGTVLLGVGRVEQLRDNMACIGTPPPEALWADLAAGTI